MSNRFQSVSAGVAELKNFYEGPIVDQFSEDVPVYRQAEKVKKGWSGYQVIRPLKVRRNQGIGATSDGGNLPNIGRQTTIQAQISAKFNYLRFGITGPMIKSSQSDMGSFVRAAAYELEEGYNDLMNDVNRQLGWDGSGYLATLSAAVAGSQSVSIQGRESTEAALKFLDVGMAIDIVDTSGNYKAQNVEISSVSGTATAATATIVLASAVTASSGDKIIRAGSLNQEIQGLLYALDGNTTTIYGTVDRSLYPITQGNVTDLSGGQVTLDQMQAVYNEGLRRGGAKGYGAIMCDFDSLRMYQKLLTADKRYQNTIQGDGGFAKKDKFYLEFNGTPLVPDKDMARRFMFLPGDVLKNYVLAEMEFADETGTMYIAQTSVDALEVRIRLFNNLFNEKAAACGVLKNYISP